MTWISSVALPDIFLILRFLMNKPKCQEDERFKSKLNSKECAGFQDGIFVLNIQVLHSMI